MGREIWVPFLPPSLNEMYKTVVKRGGKKMVPLRVLTKEAKGFKNRFSADVVPRNQEDIREIAEMLEDPNVVLVVTATCYFETLVNKTWPSGAKNRFKKLDADNRGKITFDCLVDAFGDVDDSRIFHSANRKEQADGSGEGVLLDIDMEFCDSFGIPKVAWRRG